MTPTQQKSIDALNVVLNRHHEFRENELESSSDYANQAYYARKAKEAKVHLREALVAFCLTLGIAQKEIPDIFPYYFKY